MKNNNEDNELNIEDLELVNDDDSDERGSGDDENIVDNDVNSEIEKLNAMNADLQDRLVRQMAETENVRTRNIKSVKEARDYAILEFAKDIIPVMDNFTRAMEHLPSEMGDDLKAIIDGIQMTQKELSEAFKKNHIEVLNPQPGNKFDYNQHHAISQIVTDDFEAGTIVSTMQVGYQLKERLIRPASVVVSKK